MRERFFAIVFLAWLAPLAAQQPSTAPRPVSGLLEAMKSSDFGEREKAFDEAARLLASPDTSPSDAESLRLGTIRLLIDENARNNVSLEDRMRRAAEQSSKTRDGCQKGADHCPGDVEEDEEEDDDSPEATYLPRLIAAVAGFKDERAIPALAGALEWRGSAAGALLAFGDRALGPVIDQLHSLNSSRRMMALDTAIEILETGDDRASRARIAELIGQRLNDPIPVVRSHVVREIDCRKDRRDFVPRLQQVARTDPDKLPGRADDGGDGGQFYPVRAEARRALRHIQNNQPCTPP